jgi:hypothetical protein
VLQVGICGFPEDSLPYEAQDDRENREEKDIGAGGPGYSASDVEGDSGDDDEEEGTERKKRLRSLEDLDRAETEGEEEDGTESNVFGKGEAHSFSLFLDPKLVRLA